jgi:thioredoxin 1
VSNKYFEGLLKSLVVSATLGLVSATAASTTVADQLVQVPVQGMVTMVDLGAKQCIPCKMMAPIIEELENEYKNRAAIVFIDVWEDPDAARNYGIKLIPPRFFTMQKVTKRTDMKDSWRKMLLLPS